MKPKWRRFFCDFLLLVLFVLIVYLLLQKTFFLLFPIFLAYLFSEGIRKSLDKLKPLSPLVKRVLTVLVLLIFFSLLSLFTVLLTERFIHYATYFARFLSDNLESIALFCKEKALLLEDALSRILKTDLRGSFAASLPDVLGKMAQKALENIPKWIGDMVSLVPRFFVSLIIFLVSCYYFSCDWVRFSRFVTQRIPEDKRKMISQGKKQFFHALRQYGKAYFLLFLISFAQLFLGLVLLRVNGALGISLLIALVDLLPVLGCGTVLVPWSVCAFLLGNASLGAGLLILHVVILTVRQFAEPKIVGSSIGLHPLLSLLLVMFGLRFFGFCGMILLPLAAASFFQIRNSSSQ